MEKEERSIDSLYFTIESIWGTNFAWYEIIQWITDHVQSWMKMILSSFVEFLDVFKKSCIYIFFLNFSRE